MHMHMEARSNVGVLFYGFPLNFETELSLTPELADQLDWPVTHGTLLSSHLQHWDYHT